MSRNFSGGRRVVGLTGLVLGAFVIVTTAATPAGAQTSPSTPCPSGPPVLQLGNPNPGDVLPTGDYIVSGLAFDPAATDGSGVARVDLFLGNRDTGGVFLASAAPGENAAFGNGRAFEVKATLPSSANGGHDFVAYAYSSVTGQQTSVSVPVFVGASPTPTPTGNSAPTPVALSETTQSTCQGSGAMAPAAPSTGSLAFRPLPVPGMQAGPVLQLGNPNSGDVLPTGDIIIQGVAYDPAASQGSGVDSVELFLDSRDNGGIPLGSGVPNGHTFSIKATLPSTANGGHTFVAYAHSTITDQVSATSVPVFVGAAPTPTPRPKS